ncbi:Indoleamine 2,3-dioxygenase [Mycena filopes]|nr:Indoleamine 2,3-dioxygenase [Mycena filopes]
MDAIPPDHFLSLSRLDGLLGSSESVYDTSTLAAHDFDVDNRTGFMPPQAPPSRLAAEWEVWEAALDRAIKQGLQLGDKPGITEVEMACSESWREGIRELPILPIAGMLRSETQLRRAHLVLVWLMHFYIHSLPPTAPVIIPAPLARPLFHVCAQLQLPPVLTYADTVLYNWTLKTASSRPTPALDNLRSTTLFTGTTDEEVFYLTSARMELRGVEALALMRATMDEAFVGDALALRRITTFLTRLATVIDDLRVLLATVRDGCDPSVFYNAIRPWFRGADSGVGEAARRWVFEGMEGEPGWVYPAELSGASAGQSSLIHALDMFLGVAAFSHAPGLTGASASASASTSTTSPAQGQQQETTKKSPFLERMQLYMPRHHRNFLNHLAANPRPLRAIVASAAAGDAGEGAEDAGDEGVDAAGGAELLGAYNAAVGALKRFRDYHITIVTAYIIQPARRAAAAAASSSTTTTSTPISSFLAATATPGQALKGELEKEKQGEEGEEPLRGTGGTELARFLKAVRDRTAAAIIEA